MPLVYSNEMLQADELIDEMKNNKDIAGIIAQSKEADPDLKLYLSAVAARYKLVHRNSFVKIEIAIVKSSNPTGDVCIALDEDRTEYKDYKKYKDFIICAYKNLVDEDKRKALITPKYILAPRGSNFENSGDFSVYIHPGYLVYER